MTKKSNTNWEKIEELEKKSKLIDTSDLPEITKEEWKKAVIEYPEVQQKSVKITMRMQPRLKNYYQSKYKNYSAVMHKILEKEMERDINNSK